MAVLTGVLVIPVVLLLRKIELGKSQNELIEQRLEGVRDNDGFEVVKSEDGPLPLTLKGDAEIELQENAFSNEQEENGPEKDADLDDTGAMHISSSRSAYISGLISDLRCVFCLHQFWALIYAFVMCGITTTGFIETHVRLLHFLLKTSNPFSHLPYRVNNSIASTV